MRGGVGGEDEGEWRIRGKESLHPDADPNDEDPPGDLEDDIPPAQVVRVPLTRPPTTSAAPTSTIGQPSPAVSSTTSSTTTNAGMVIEKKAGKLYFSRPNGNPVVSVPTSSTDESPTDSPAKRPKLDES